MLWKVEKKMLIGELTQGRELAAQLNQLDPVESREACQALVEKIVSTYDRVLSLLNFRGLKGDAESDLVETFHQTSAGLKNQGLKKRKTVARWNEEMSVFSAADGGEESLKDDGHRWLKYGQKAILGAKFPRAYYRCRHWKTEGCLATKKVQRCDYDSSIFQISYKACHTCIQTSISSSTIIPITNTISKLNPHTDHTLYQTSRIQTTPPDALRNLQQGLQVETENMGLKEDILTSFSFNNPFIQIDSAGNVDNELFWSLL